MRTAQGLSYTITGRVATREGGRTTFTARWEPILGATGHLQRFLGGTVSEDGLSLSGVWSEDERTDLDDELPQSKKAFYFTRSSPELLTVRPPPWALKAQDTKTQALWRFALDATLLQVRRRRKWWYLQDFITRCNAYLDLLAPRTSLSRAIRWNRRWTSLRIRAARLSQIERTFTFDEACFCHIVLELRNRTLNRKESVHFNI